MSLLSAPPGVNAAPAHRERQLKAVTQSLAWQFYLMSKCRGMGSLGIFILLNSLSKEIFAVLYKTCTKNTCWSLAWTSHCPGVWLQVWGAPDTDGRNSHFDFSQQNGRALSEIGKSWTGKGTHWLPGKSRFQSMLLNVKRSETTKAIKYKDYIQNETLKTQSAIICS